MSAPSLETPGRAAATSRSDEMSFRTAKVPDHALAAKRFVETHHRGADFLGARRRAWNASTALRPEPRRGMRRDEALAKCLSTTRDGLMLPRHTPWPFALKRDPLGATARRACGDDAEARTRRASAAAEEDSDAARDAFRRETALARRERDSGIVTGVLGAGHRSIAFEKPFAASSGAPRGWSASVEVGRDGEATEVSRRAACVSARAASETILKRSAKRYVSPLQAEVAKQNAIRALKTKRRVAEPETARDGDPRDEKKRRDESRPSRRRRPRRVRSERKATDLRRGEAVTRIARFRAYTFRCVMMMCGRSSVCSRIHVAASFAAARPSRSRDKENARVLIREKQVSDISREKKPSSSRPTCDSSEFDATADRRPVSFRAMDAEPQYPVDATTQDAMQDAAGGGGAPDATNAANLDEYMRESGGVKKSRGGRGSGGERLKVRAVIVKRTSGPTGGSRGGRGRGPSGGVLRKVRRRDPRPRVRDPLFRAVRHDAPSSERSRGRSPHVFFDSPPPPRHVSIPHQRERVYKREDGFVAVHIYGKDVIVVAPTGEVRLDAAGDTGHNTFRAMNESLNKFGFKLSKSPSDETQWTLGDGKRFLKRYEDGMTIPAPVPPGPGRALALMQRDDPPVPSSRGFGGRGFGGRGRGIGARGRGRY